jgi:hypothetical protein
VDNRSWASIARKVADVCREAAEDRKGLRRS